MKKYLLLVLLLAACTRDGAQGPQGEPGPAGANGSVGSTGTAGADGVSCSVASLVADALVAPNGGAIVTCGETTSVILNGTPGTNGVNGTSGTLVSPIKLCADDTTSYPEYALKVGSQIFAVYWGKGLAGNSAKTAFLALITPGSYTSTGGNECSFSIDADGNVN